MIQNLTEDRSLSKETVGYIRRYLLVHMGFDYWDDKDEAIEECLEHCRRKAAKYRGDNGARFETFLVTVARRKALSQIDKRDRRRKLLTENWQFICRQPWVYGAHDAFSLEEDRLISANFDQPMFASFGQ